MDTLTRYAKGESYREIEKATGRKRRIISQDLHDAELVSNYRLRCGLVGARGTTKKSGRDLKTLIADTRQGRKVGQHAASLLGWHNLRGTFVVLALNAGLQLSGKGARKALPEAKADPVAQVAAQLQALTKADRARLAALLGERKQKKRAMGLTHSNADGTI